MNYLCNDFGHVHTLMTTFYEVFTFQRIDWLCSMSILFRIFLAEKLDAAKSCSYFV